MKLKYPEEALLAAFGKVSVRHGHLDYVLKLAVRSIAGIDLKEALDATARQGSRELRERVRKLAKQRFGEGVTLTRLDALLNRARRAVEKRNELLHCLYLYDGDGNPLRRLDDHSFDLQPSVVEIETIADEIKAIGQELNDAFKHGFLKEELDRTA